MLAHSADTAEWARCRSRGVAAVSPPGRCCVARQGCPVSPGNLRSFGREALPPGAESRARC